jgi:hypothetical protein
VALVDTMPSHMYMTELPIMQRKPNIKKIAIIIVFCANKEPKKPANAAYPIYIMIMPIKTIPSASVLSLFSLPENSMYISLP